MFGDSRAQAYTLEGFIGSILVLTAVLFALQSVVITPTTTGTVDRDVRDQVRVEANDILTLGAESGNLSAMVRYWNGTGDVDPDQVSFAYVDEPVAGYSDTLPPDGAPKGFLKVLNRSFENKIGYNVIVTYQGPNGTTGYDDMTMVRNTRTKGGIVATYRITLYDDQRLTGPGGDQRPLSWYDTDPDAENGYYPIPDAYPNSPVYNVVIVRVTVS